MSFASAFEPLLALFGQGSLLLALLAGLVTGTIMGAVPGLNGRLGILFLFPVLPSLPVAEGIVLLISMHAVVHTGGSLPSILFGIPGTGADAATVVDGYPMTKRGLAGEALGASFSASAVGGVIGALVLLALLPAAQVVALTLGAPEYLLISLIGLCAAVVLAGRSLCKGLAVATLGLLVATVGLDPIVSEQRFTFGRYELWGGISPAVIFAGLFAVPELLALTRRGGKLLEGERVAVDCSYRAVLTGLSATFRHWGLTIRTSLLGAGIGFLPGMGADVAAWLAYGHAAQSVKSRIPYGQGAVEGVIAPETANNSKEGGSLAPTLFFGIPGSASMALMLTGFLLLGVPVGPDFLAQHQDLLWLIFWTLVVSNLMAVVLLLLMVPLFGAIAYFRTQYIIPAALAFSVMALATEALDWLRLALLLGFSVLGHLLLVRNWPRPPFLLGFVLGPLIETSLSQTRAIYGWAFLERPASLVLVALLGFTLLWGLRKQRRPVATGDEPAAGIGSDRRLALAFAALALAAGWAAWQMPAQAAFQPLVACGALLIFVLPLILAHQPRAPARPAADAGWAQFFDIAAFLLGVWLIGLPAASAAFVCLYLALRFALPWHKAAVSGLLVALFQWGFFVRWLEIPLDAGRLERLF